MCLATGVWHRVGYGNLSIAPSDNSCPTHVDTSTFGCAQVADMLALPFPDGQFDVVIEKATTDVLFVENDNPFDPKEEVKQRVFQMLNETHRYFLAMFDVK